MRLEDLEELMRLNLDDSGSLVVVVNLNGLQSSCLWTPSPRIKESSFITVLSPLAARLRILLCFLVDFLLAEATYGS